MKWADERAFVRCVVIVRANHIQQRVTRSLDLSTAGLPGNTAKHTERWPSSQVNERASAGFVCLFV